MRSNIKLRNFYSEHEECVFFLGLSIFVVDVCQDIVPICRKWPGAGSLRNNDGEYYFSFDAGAFDSILSQNTIIVIVFSKITFGPVLLFFALSYTTLRLGKFRESQINSGGLILRARRLPNYAPKDYVIVSWPRNKVIMRVNRDERDK